MGVDKHQLTYRRSGTGATVVLVHGIPGSGRAWSRVEASLGDRVDVIVPDLLGFGHSDVEHLDAEAVGSAAQTTALVTLLDALTVRGAVVVGHDFGVPLAIQLAGRRPDLVSGLVLLSGNVFPDTPVPFPLSLVSTPLIGPLAQRVLFSDPSLTLMLRQGTGPRSETPDASVYLGSRRQRKAIATIFATALTHLTEHYAPVEAALRELSVPVQVGWGDRDPFFDLTQGRRTAEAVGTPLHVFEGAGHFIPHERPDEVATMILDLVATAPAPDASIGLASGAGLGWCDDEP